jgi:hypothetical protein
MAREREDGHVYFVGGLVAFPGEFTIPQPFAQLAMNRIKLISFYCRDGIFCDAR